MRYKPAPPVDVNEASSNPATPTTAEYMLEVDDVVTPILHAPAMRKQLRSVRRALLIVPAIGLFVMGMLLLSQWRAGAPLRARTTFIAFLALCVVLGASLSPPVVRRRVKQSCEKIYAGSLPWAQHVALSSEGVHVVTPYFDARHFWQGFASIDASATHAFFYMNAIHAVVVPARAFPSEVHFEAFVNLARQLRDRARSPSLPQ